jgi:endonuclease/exonuclease/phosphatase family metal-dependent hydrolase
VITVAGRLASVFACGAAIVFGACASATRGGTLDSSRVVRVLVYNIHAGKDAAGVDNLAGVAALVRDTRADLVLLQEVDQGTRRSGNVDQPAVLALRTGLHVAFGSALDYDGGEYGVAILSRWPIIDDTLIHLPVEPPQQRAGGSHEPRGALRTVVQAPWGRTIVFTTHLDASGPDTYRRQEGRTVSALVADARRSNAFVMIGGDFNSTPESLAQQELRASGLRDAHGECGRGDGFTFPAESPVKRIDYLFLTGPMTCTSAEVIETRVSDHRPVIFEVRIPAG